MNINNILQDINTMTSSTPVCGICVSRHIYKTSEIWCSECDEGLCMDCTQHHSVSPYTIRLYHWLNAKSCHHSF